MQLFAQRTTALDEERLVDGLVGHLHLRVDRGTPEPTTPRSAEVTTWPRACARRPLGAGGTGQAWPSSAAAPAGTPPGRPPGPGISCGPPLALTSRQTVEGDRPRSAAMARIESARRQAPRDLLAFLEREPQLRALPSTSDASLRARNELAQREFCLPRCLAMRFTGTPASRMSQMVCFSASLKRLTTTPPDRRTQCSPIRLVLQRPLEGTALRG